MTEDEYWDKFRKEINAVLNEREKSPPKDENEMIEFKEAAKELGISTSTLYKMVGSKKIKFIKQGAKKLLFQRKDINDWLSENRK